MGPGLTRSSARPLLRGEGPQDAELVALRVGEHDPGLVALADVGERGTQCEQPGHLGIAVVRTRVGDRYEWEELERQDAQFGGEPSGHVIFRGYSTTGIKYQFLADRLNEVVGVGGFRTHRTVRVKATTSAKGRPTHEAVAEVLLDPAPA